MSMKASSPSERERERAREQARDRRLSIYRSNHIIHCTLLHQSSLAIISPYESATRISSALSSLLTSRRRRPLTRDSRQIVQRPFDGLIYSRHIHIEINGPRFLSDLAGRPACAALIGPARSVNNRLSAHIALFCCKNSQQLRKAQS